MIKGDELPRAWRARVAAPGRIEDLALRPQLRPRVAVTVETELHRELHRLIGQRHLIHHAVTARAADTLRDMDAVIEIDIVGQIGHPAPDDRPVLRKTEPDRFE